MRQNIVPPDAAQDNIFPGSCLLWLSCYISSTQVKIHWIHEVKQIRRELANIECVPELLRRYEFALYRVRDETEGLTDKTSTSF